MPLLGLAGAAACWAAAVFGTGGFAARVGVWRISSRSPVAALAVALVCSAAAWLISTPEERRRALPATWRLIGRASADVERAWPRRAPLVAGALAIGVVVIGLGWGTYVAAGADAYGYASQADLWAQGNLRVEEPLMSDPRWDFSPNTLAPLGYTPSPDRKALVPFYSPGLPMMMGLFRRLAGPVAVYCVVPLLGGLAVWATYLLGAALSSRGTGAAAALLMATSPPFLSMLLFPMSDVPVTAWWALSLALALGDSRWAALGSGLAAAAAIATRPNLVPLAAVPGLVFVWRSWNASAHRRIAAERALVFGLGVLPGPLLIGVLNHRLYGAWYRSAYGTAERFFDMQYVRGNLAAYVADLVEYQTPLIVLALAAPLLVASRIAGPRGRPARWPLVACLAFIGGVAASYLGLYAYGLRYLLPAFPPLLVLTSATMIAGLDRWASRAATLAATVAVGLVAWHGVTVTYQDGVFETREDEEKTLTIGQFISDRLPANAALLSMQLSGSARHYGHRLTIRYDWIDRARLDHALGRLREIGYKPYILLEEWEEPMFRERFQPQSTYGALDWPAVVRLDRSTRIRIYDPLDRDDPDGASRRMQVIP
jgi:hypothetical protein